MRLIADDPSSVTSRLRLLFTDKEFEQTAEKIVRNSYRLDLHFLPADGQPKDWSAVAEHSVVLFRYPMSVPLDLLDAAQTQSLKDWPALSFIARNPIRFRGGAGGSITSRIAWNTTPNCLSYLASMASSFRANSA